MIVEHYVHHTFPFSDPSFFLYHNLFSKNSPLVDIWNFAGDISSQAVWCCRRWVSAPFAIRLVFLNRISVLPETLKMVKTPRKHQPCCTGALAHFLQCGTNWNIQRLMHYTHLMRSWVVPNSAQFQWRLGLISILTSPHAQSHPRPLKNFETTH